MKKLVNYLTFNGNCREAMEFYQICLGGKLVIQTIDEDGGSLPALLKSCVVHACLRNEYVTLLGTDMVGAEGLVRGNAVSLFLETSDDEELRTIYIKLAKFGEPRQPLSTTIDGSLFGSLTDRFGNHWLLHCNIYGHGTKT